MKFFKKDELKLLWPFYLSKCAFTIFYVMIPFEILYFLDIGFSFSQIGIITSAVFAAGFLFEIPTGAIADIYGRKTSSIVGYFLSSLAMILVFFTTNFYSMVGLYFFLGFAGTFISGAQEAWIIDKLHQNKRKSLIHDYYARSHSLFSAGFLLSGILGSILVGKFGLSVIWPITSVHFLLTGLLFLFVSEKHNRKKFSLSGHYKDLKNQTKKSIKYSFSHYNLKLFMIGMFFLGLVLVMLGGLTWFPFIKGMGLDEKYFGYLFSLGWVLGMIIPHFTKKLVGLAGGYKRYLVIVWILLFLLTSLVLFANSLIFVIVVFIISSSLWDFHRIGNAPFVQSFIPSEMRATIKSLQMQILSLTAIFGTILTGFLAETIGVRYTLVIGAIFVVPLIFIYSKIKD